MGRLTAAVAPLLELVVPLRCVRCAAPGVALCPHCLGPGAPLMVELAIESGAPLSAWAAGAYEDGLRSAVVAYKERGRRPVGAVLSPLLALAVELALDGWVGDVALVPVPSSRAAARSRGGPHMLRLAREVAPQVGLPVAPKALWLRRATRDSAGLGIEERHANLAGAMAAAQPPGGLNPPAAVVVDDVITTGATLVEAVRALRRSGWSVAGAAVIAATPLRFARRC